MKVRFLMVGSYEYSGSGKGMTYYAQGLLASGFSVDFLSFGEPHFCNSQPDCFIGSRRSVVRPHVLPFDNSPRIADALALVNDVIAWVTAEPRTPTVIWGHYLYPYASAVLLASGLLTQESVSCRAIITPAGTDVWNPDIHLTPLIELACRLAKPLATVFYSERFRAEGLGSYPFLHDAAPCVVEPVVSETVFRPSTDDEREDSRTRLGIARDDHVISLVSNMRPRKNLDNLDRILSSLRVAELAPTLLLVGPAVRCKIGNCKLISTGVVDDVRPYLWASDANINVSLRDSFNFSLLEAMLCCIPTFTTGNAAISDAMATVCERTVFNLNDLPSIKRAGAMIRSVLRNRAEAASLGALQRSKMQRRFGLIANRERFGNEIVQILRNAKYGV